MNPTTDRHDESHPLHGDGQHEPLTTDASPPRILVSTSVKPRTRFNGRTNQQSTSKVQFTTDNNFYKNVTENKDIAKLVSQLATCITTTKTV